MSIGQNQVDRLSHEAFDGLDVDLPLPAPFKRHGRPVDLVNLIGRNRSGPGSVPAYPGGHSVQLLGESACPEAYDPQPRPSRNLNVNMFLTWKLEHLAAILYR